MRPILPDFPPRSYRVELPRAAARDETWRQGAHARGAQERVSTTGRSSDENGRVLWVGTKSPWPTRDGGRLVAYHTIRALAEAGLALRLIAPGDPTGEDTRGRPCEADLLPIDPRSRTEALLRAALSGRPVTAERHAHAALRARVEEQLARGGCSTWCTPSSRTRSTPALPRSPGACRSSCARTTSKRTCGPSPDACPAGADGSPAAKPRASDAGSATRCGAAPAPSPSRTRTRSGFAPWRAPRPVV